MLNEGDKMGLVGCVKEADATRRGSVYDFDIDKLSTNFEREMLTVSRVNKLSSLRIYNMY